MGVYNYKVLRALDPRAELSSGDWEKLGKPDVIFVPCGEHKAKEPGLAALAAAHEVGEPGTYHPIPERNFNEVPIIPSTGFQIGEPGEDLPPPPPPDGEGATSVSDLAPGLNAEHPCETEECGHLPMLHGAKGLGICRVDDCPCGKYSPAP
jgi:hypothetical protein